MTAKLPNEWWTMPTTALENLLDTLDDSTDAWDKVAREVAIRRDDPTEPPDDTPSLDLPSYSS